MSKDVTLKGKILGFVWTSDDQPIKASVVFDHQPDRIMYISGSFIDETFKRKAAERGTSVGEMVDEVNSQIGIPIGRNGVLWNLDALTSEQLDYLFKMVNR